MAWADLPPLEPRAVRYNTLPPEKRKLIGLLCDDAFFHLPDKGQAVLQIEHTALALVQLIEVRIFITRIIYRTRVAAQIFEQVQIRFVHEFAIEVHAGIEIPLAQIVEIRSALLWRVRDIQADFAPLIHQVDTAHFIPFFDVAVFQNERESLGHARLLEYTLRFSALGVDVFAKPGKLNELSGRGCNLRPRAKNTADIFHHGN